MEKHSRSILLALFLLLAAKLAFPAFILESVDITAKDIKEDGSASVAESIKMIVESDNSRMLYNSVFDANDLSTWASVTGFAEMRTHTNRRFVDVSNFRVMPQKLTKCSALSNTCHGEVILTYKVSPYYLNGSVLNNTGLFFADKYKPRTIRYTLNQNALELKKSEKGDIIIENKIFFDVVLPPQAKVVDVNPRPDNDDYARTGKMTWSDTILVNFALVFEVEKSIDTEVFEFFSSIPRNMASVIAGDQGPAVILIVLILLGSYIYLRSVSKKKGMAGGQ